MAKVDVYGHTRMVIALVVVATLLPLSMLGQYRLIIRPVDKDSAFVQQNLRLQQSFRNQDFCREYVGNLPVLLLILTKEESFLKRSKPRLMPNGERKR